MPASDIISVPDKRLRETSSRIAVVTDEVEAIIEKMKAATLDWEAQRDSEVGVALAAVQIGEMERIVVVRNRPDDKSDKDFETFINPEIVKYEGEVSEEPEGCLSIPDIYGVVPRHETVRIKALDINGNPFRVKVSGFLARVFQHEIDHLRGKLFVDHVKADKFYRIEQDGKLTPLTAEEIDSARILWDC